jgi:hypothetical protein
MRVFTCIDHDNRSVGVASVVVAADEAEAKHLLDAELATHGLKPFASRSYTLREILTETPRAFVLQDGDY